MPNERFDHISRISIQVMSQGHAKNCHAYENFSRFKVRPVLADIERWRWMCGLVVIGALTVACGDPPAEGGADDAGVCVSGCSASATLGDPCARSADCPQGASCNLGFPDGYCESPCQPDGLGLACGPGAAGVCVADPTDEAAPPSCLAACEFAQPGDCPHPQSVCYPLQSDGDGACGLRCEVDEDCGPSFQCDSRGLCRPTS